MSGSNRGKVYLSPSSLIFIGAKGSYLKSCQRKGKHLNLSVPSTKREKRFNFYCSDGRSPFNALVGDTKILHCFLIVPSRHLWGIGPQHIVVRESKTLHIVVCWHLTGEFPLPQAHYCSTAQVVIAPVRKSRPVLLTIGAGLSSMRYIYVVYRKRILCKIQRPAHQKRRKER